MPATTMSVTHLKKDPRAVRLLGAPALLVLSLAMLLFVPAAHASGGGAMGWGYDFYGQAGNGAGVGSGCQCLTVPTAMSGVVDTTQVSGGYTHTLALLSDGTVRAWGANTYGQLGNGSTTQSATGVAVSGVSGVIAVAAANGHSLALLANGTVMAWGRNAEGQLGLGSSVGPESCSLVACSRTPAVVPGLAEVVAIAAAGNYNLALLASGSVVAWGADGFGQLGDGGVQTGCKCADHPVPVPGVAGAMAISAGSLVGAALLSNGTVMDWGDNFFGGLGTGARTVSPPCDCLGPVMVGGISSAKAIAVGELQAMALLADGSVQAWGYNNQGQLGNGAASTTGCECVPAPAPVSGLGGVQEIAAGIDHGLALLVDGSARSWGRGLEGQLGDGGTSQRVAPVAVGGLSGASAIAAGEYSSFAQVGPSQSLAVTVTGSGAGTVGGPKSILCPPACARPFPQGQVEILRAEPAAGSAFAGFSGACTGTGPCQLRMDSDQAVAATFGPPSGTRIDKATIKGKKKLARFSFSAPGAITGFECKLTRPKPHHKKRKPKAKGHKRVSSSASKAAKPRFAACGAPKTYKHLAVGGYTFQVRALDSLGADPKPATRKFKIKAPKRVKHHKRGR